MTRKRLSQVVLLLASFALLLPSAVAQVVIATVDAGVQPSATAVNPATNNIYVVNSNCANNGGCSTTGSVTVINGATNNPTTVNVGVLPVAVAVNVQTNQIYVANECGNDITCSSPGTVTVIDGATNNTTTLNVGAFPVAVGVNQITNQIYVANNCGNDLTCASPGTVSVIAGGSNNVGSVQVEYFPSDVEVNTVTNFIYVVNSCGNDGSCSSAGTVTVINGTTDATTNVNVGVYPYVAAINSVTNMIYVPNNCGNDLSCESLGTVTVINGSTNNTSTLGVGAFPYGVSVNAVTNNIYVVNNCGNDTGCGSPGTVSVIAGGTNNIQTVPIGNYNETSINSTPAIDAVTNQIYVPNYSDATVTDIDGASNNTTTVDVGNQPNAAAMNTLTNRVYVDNYSDGTVSVIAGTGSPAPLRFFPVTPCRLVDTRSNGGPIAGETSRIFNLPQLAQKASPPCASLASAAAYSLNVTVVPIVPLGYLTIWPTGEDQPFVSTMNSPDGRIKANAAIVPAGYQGSVNVYVSNTADVILDIDGYFEPPATGTYQFYPLTPCRIVDTRDGKDQGTLQAGVERDYLIAGACGIPSNATAYSFNVTVLPAAGGLDYLTVWPKGDAQPVVSTLNDNTGTVVANAAIVPAGSDGSTAFYAHNNDTDLLLDVDGYFAAPGTGGLSMYSVPPCRVLDTRQSGGSFVGEKTVNVVGSACAPPVSAAAYIFNATVVPPGPMLFLTLWPDGEQQPTVSTLNAEDGFITSNMAIVPTNNGSIDAYAYALTQLILDISGYFAP